LLFNRVRFCKEIQVDDPPISHFSILPPGGRLDNPPFTCCFDDPLEYNIKALERMAAAVKPKVDMGFHLCYGDIGHQHFVEPEDMSVMVEISTGLLRQVHPIHKIAWIHMPVPKNRTDQGYFTPLTMLQLPSDTELFLGLLHPDGLENTMLRIQSAQNTALKEFGVATECGLGRTNGREGFNLLDMAVQVSRPYT
jgi:methionine synthase II (cobalamin-independent)